MEMAGRWRLGPRTVGATLVTVVVLAWICPGAHAADECAVPENSDVCENATASLQECVDPDVDVDSDWQCRCVDAIGAATAAPSTCEPYTEASFDECAECPAFATAMKNKRYTGGSLLKLALETVDACIDECSYRAECQAFVFVEEHPERGGTGPCVYGYGCCELLDSTFKSGGRSRGGEICGIKEPLGTCEMGACRAAGQICVDPTAKTGTVNDWQCWCRGGLWGVGMMEVAPTCAGAASPLTIDECDAGAGCPNTIGSILRGEQVVSDSAVRYRALPMRSYTQCANECMRASATDDCEAFTFDVKPDPATVVSPCIAEAACCLLYSYYTAMEPRMDTVSGSVEIYSPCAHDDPSWDTVCAQPGALGSCTDPSFGSETLGDWECRCDEDPTIYSIAAVKWCPAPPTPLPPTPEPPTPAPSTPLPASTPVPPSPAPTTPSPPTPAPPTPRPPTPTPATPVPAPAPPTPQPPTPAPATPVPTPTPGTPVPTPTPATPTPSPVTPPTPFPPTPAPPSPQPRPPAPVPPTPSPPTPAPPTPVPTTSVPETLAPPPTDPPPTLTPATQVPATQSPVTPAPPVVTGVPITPSTPSLATTVPATVVPTTGMPGTGAPATGVPAVATDVPGTAVPQAQPQPVAVSTTVPAPRVKANRTDGEAIMKTVGDASSVTAVVGSVFGDGGAATRLLALSMTCDPVTHDPMERYSFIMAPLGLEIGGSRPLGTLIGNVVIVLVVMLVWYVLGVIATKLELPRIIDEEDGFGLVCFPAAPFVINKLMFQGTALAAMDLVLGSGNDMIRILAGILGVLWCFTIPAYHMYESAAAVPRHAYIKDDPETTTRVMTWFVGRGEWVSRTKEFHWIERYAHIRLYTEAGYWYPILEHAMIFAISALQAPLPDNFVGCGHIKVATSLVCLMSMVLEAKLWPHLCTRNGVFDCLIHGTQAFAMVCLAVGYYKGDRGHPIFQFGSHLLLLCLIMLLMRTAFDGLGAATAHLSGRRRRLQLEVWIASSLSGQDLVVPTTLSGQSDGDGCSVTERESGGEDGGYGKILGPPSVVTASCEGLGTPGLPQCSNSGGARIPLLRVDSTEMMKAEAALSSAAGNARHGMSPRGPKRRLRARHASRSGSETPVADEANSSNGCTTSAFASRSRTLTRTRSRRPSTISLALSDSPTASPLGGGNRRRRTIKASTPLLGIEQVTDLVSPSGLVMSSPCSFAAACSALPMQRHLSVAEAREARDVARRRTSVSPIAHRTSRATNVREVAMGS